MSFHDRLLAKLDFYGIRSATKKWISSFLTKILQRVVVNGKTSAWIPVLSGTPQGTVLGSHLFLLHINDIQNGVKSTTRLFADDCLIYRPVSCPIEEEEFQADLNTMVNWSNSWGMSFNPPKCRTMRISRKRNSPPTAYEMMDVRLEQTSHNQYLGVHIQHDLRWNKQVDHAKFKAFRVLNFLRRNFHHSPSSIKEKLYTMLARPHLEYASAAWDPYTARNIKDLEKVQNAAARFTTNIYGENTSVTALKSRLQWPPLQERRRRGRLSCFYKMLHGQLDINQDKYIAPKSSRPRRGHNKQFQIAQTNTDAHMNSFFNRTIVDWNGLPN